MHPNKKQMSPKTISYGILRAIGILAGIALLGYFLYLIRFILLYIAIAAIVALVGRPMVSFLQNRLRLPMIVSVIFTLFLIFTVVLGVLALFIPIISQQSENLGRLDLDEIKTNINILNSQIQNYLGLELETNLLKDFNISSYLENFDFKSIPLFMNSIVGTVGAIIIGVFAVVFISFFFLSDSTLLFNSVMAFSQKGNEAKFTRVFNKIKNLLSRYFIGIALQIFVLFILYTILLLIFEVQSPFSIAFICAFLNIVPYLGPFIAGILMVFFAGADHIGSDFSTVILPNMLYILAGYLVAQLIDNFISQPLIFGQSVKSHPLEIFLVILTASILFGVFGMIIAVPCYTAIKVIAKESLSRYKFVDYLTKGL